MCSQIIPTLVLAVVNAFTNESHKTKSSEDIDHDKIATLDNRVRAIKGVDMYDPIQAVKCVWSRIL